MLYGGNENPTQPKNDPLPPAPDGIEVDTENEPLEEQISRAAERHFSHTLDMTGITIELMEELQDTHKPGSALVDLALNNVDEDDYGPRDKARSVAQQSLNKAMRAFPNPIVRDEEIDIHEFPGIMVRASEYEDRLKDPHAEEKQLVSLYLDLQAVAARIAKQRSDLGYGEQHRLSMAEFSEKMIKDLEALGPTSGQDPLKRFEEFANAHPENAQLQEVAPRIRLVIAALVVEGFRLTKDATLEDALEFIAKNGLVTEEELEVLTGVPKTEGEKEEEATLLEPKN